jgi:hypothetical protein
VQNKVLNNKISDYNNSKIEIDQLISISKTARYYAVLDLCNGYHAAQFRNIYFYFNPLDSLLEPIGREFATNYYQPTGPSYLYPLELNKFDEALSLSSQRGFMDFEKHFFSHLKEISDIKFLEEFFNQIRPELIERQFCLYKAAPSIKSFSESHYYKNQTLIRKYFENKYTAHNNK